MASLGPVPAGLVYPRPWGWVPGNGRYDPLLHVPPQPTGPVLSASCRSTDAYNFVLGDWFSVNRQGKLLRQPIRFRQWLAASVKECWTAVGLPVCTVQCSPTRPEHSKRYRGQCEDCRISIMFETPACYLSFRQVLQFARKIELKKNWLDLEQSEQTSVRRHRQKVIMTT